MYAMITDKWGIAFCHRTSSSTTLAVPSLMQRHVPKPSYTKSSGHQQMIKHTHTHTQTGRLSQALHTGRS